MSRIGKKIIPLPKGVKIASGAGAFNVEGPKGKLSFPMHEGLSLKVDGNVATIERNGDSAGLGALHGLTRAHVANMVEGVEKGFEKILELEGVGYRAKMAGKDLELSMGFSNPVVYKVPKGIEVAVDGTTVVFVRGIDKQLVGHVAAEIRGVRPPEPYKGKGIHYRGEVIRRKAGKTGGK